MCTHSPQITHEMFCKNFLSKLYLKFRSYVSKNNGMNDWRLFRVIFKTNFTCNSDELGRTGLVPRENGVCV